MLFILTGVLFGLDESSHAAPPLGATLFLSLHAVNGHDLAHAAQGMMVTLAYEGVTTPFEHGGAHANRPE